MNDTRKAALRSERDQFEGFQRTYELEDKVLFYLQYEDKEKKAVKRKQQWIDDVQK